MHPRHNYRSISLWYLNRIRGLSMVASFFSRLSKGMRNHFQRCLERKSIVSWECSLRPEASFLFNLQCFKPVSIAWHRDALTHWKCRWVKWNCRRSSGSNIYCIRAAVLEEKHCFVTDISRYFLRRYLGDGKSPTLSFELLPGKTSASVSFFWNVVGEKVIVVCSFKS